MLTSPIALRSPPGPGPEPPEHPEASMPDGDRRPWLVPLLTLGAGVLLVAVAVAVLVSF